MDFGDFLDKIGNETGSRKKKKTTYVEHKETVVQREKPKRPKGNSITEGGRTKPIEEDNYAPKNKPTREDRGDDMSRSRIDEEFMDKAYDYAQGVIKVVRQNFRSTEERVVMLESLQHAINYYMQSVGKQPSQSYTPTTPTPQQMAETSGSLFGGQTMSENDWNNMPRTSYDQAPGSVKMNDLTGQSVNVTPPTGDYNPSLKLGIKIGPDGKQEADLSGVTSMDINEMKMLSGMIGPEAEKRKQELEAAKESVRQQIAEKQNQQG